MIICLVSISFSYKSTKKVRITGSFAEKKYNRLTPLPPSPVSPPTS